MIHNLKTWPPIFEVMANRQKSFDIRQNDRDFKVGDELMLKEYDPDTKSYTGRQARARITWILHSPNPFIELGNKVILSLEYDF